MKKLSCWKQIFNEHTLSSMQSRKNKCDSENRCGKSLTEDTVAVLNHQSANHACGICISSTLIANHSCRGSSAYLTISFHAARLDAIQHCSKRDTIVGKRQRVPAARNYEQTYEFLLLTQLLPRQHCFHRKKTSLNVMDSLNHCMSTLRQAISRQY